ncbi:hypothetical protein BpHYR1_022326 [Brachionus plicatilis]|uniref:Uncharacterized protein n=1 Tax=Brachionus plicatilis TaxID=10195 RepID=A0A3M7QCR1_BRAPC|nr:hypothetical protein BpHYR1_022326 [Brachionus plicatilis]
MFILNYIELEIKSEFRTMFMKYYIHIFKRFIQNLLEKHVFFNNYYCKNFLLQILNPVQSLKIIVSQK